jgi:hypothetical protein
MDPTGQASGGGVAGHLGMAGRAPWLGVYGLSVSLSLTVVSYGWHGGRAWVRLCLHCFSLLWMAAI